jgi:hypothetical protein
VHECSSADERTIDRLPHELGLGRFAICDLRNNVDDCFISDPFPLCAKRPRTGGSPVGSVVSAETKSEVEGSSADLSLALKSGCPATETVLKQRHGSKVRRLRVEAEHQVLTRPFGRHIAEPDDSHSV